jgi:CubicO group peptidase (beta-lactamase class C family)
MNQCVEIQGRCDARFERVREAFAREFAAGNEIGAAVCVTLEGEAVVDLWGGHQDPERTQPWQHDTLANVYSATKGITAIALHRLVDEGCVDLDAPVARYWPEFARAGKEDIPLRHLLSHEAGLAAVRRPLPPGSIYDWDAMVEALSEETPWWEPGTAHGYHALTFGWLVGEVIRRVRGRSVGAVVRDEIAHPLGVEFEIGFGPDLDGRVAPVIAGPVHAPDDGSAFDFVAAMAADSEGLLARVFGNPGPLDADTVNSRLWRAAEIPAANGHTNAHSLARIFAALANGGAVDGVRLLSPAAVERARTEQSDPRPRRLLAEAYACL